MRDKRAWRAHGSPVPATTEGDRRQSHPCLTLHLALAAGVGLLLCATTGAARASDDALSNDPQDSLSARFSAMAKSLYEKTQAEVVAPAEQAAADTLADPRTQEAYARVKAALNDVVSATYERVVQPAAQKAREMIASPEAQHSSEAADAFARDLKEKAHRYVVDPLLARFTDVLKTAPAQEAVPSAAPMHRTAAQAAIPALPEDDTLDALQGGDQLEVFNRFMFDVNDRLRQRIFDPTTDFYLKSTSPAVQDAVRNFFRNLREPVVIVSSLAEGEMADAGNATARFGINTTLGVAGFFDPATGLGFPAKARNLEETLCVYGLPSGPYLVLPILGPATLRDAVGRLATVAAYYEVMGLTLYVPYRITDIALQYADLKDKVAFVNSMSIDPYVAQKQLYLTTRSLSCGRQAAIDREFFTK